MPSTRGRQTRNASAHAPLGTAFLAPIGRPGMIDRNHRDEALLVPARPHEQGREFPSPPPPRSGSWDHREALPAARSGPALSVAPGPPRRSQFLPVAHGGLAELSAAAEPAPSSPASPSGWPSSARTTCARCRPCRNPEGEGWRQGAPNGAVGRPQTSGGSGRLGGPTCSSTASSASTSNRAPR